MKRGDLGTTRGLGLFLGAVLWAGCATPAKVGSEVAPPAPVSVRAADAKTGGTVDLSWSGYDESNDKAGIVAYLVFEDAQCVTDPTRTPAATVPGGTQSFTATGLQNGRSYQFSVAALDGQGQRGPIQSCAVAIPTDSVAPGMPTGLTAANLPGNRGGSIQLAWSPPASGAVVAYYVYRSTAPGVTADPSNFLASVTAGATSFVDVTALPVGTVFYYVVASFDGTLVSAPSNEASAASADSLPPTAPTGLAALASAGEVLVTWTAPADATGYLVFRGPAPSGALSPLATTSGSSFTDGTVAGGASYVYAVAAVNAAGTSPQSAPVSVDVPATGPSVPLPPTNLVAAPVPNAQGGSLLLSWTLSTSTGVTAQILSRSTTSSGGFVVIADLGASATSYLDTQAPTGVLYYYELEAQAGTLNSSPSNVASAASSDTLPPAAPTNLLAANTAGTDGGSITLTWTLSADDRGGARDVASYRVLRNAVLIATVPGGTAGYVDPAAVTGTTYTYTVRAVDASGNVSAASNSSSAASADTLAPSAPLNLVAVGGDAQVSLSWVNPAAPDLAQTVIRKNVGATCAYPASLTAGSGVYAGAVTGSDVDFAVSNGQAYCYSVFLVDGAGNASQPAVGFASPVAPSGVTTPAAPTSLTAADLPGDNGGAIQLYWTASTSAGVTAYRIYRGATPGFSVVPGDLIGAVSAPATTFVDTSAYPVGTTYYYIVHAYNGAESIDSNEASAYSINDLPPSAPTGLAAADVPNDLGGAIQLYWNPSTAPGVTEERLYRSTTSGSGYVEIASFSPSTTSYVDANAPVGTIFYYVMTAWNGVNLSSYSGEASGASIANEAGAVTGFFASAASGSVTLQWTMPATAPDFAGIRVERSTSGFPPTITSGTTVYNGGSTGFVDSGVVNGTTYYYTAFSYGFSGFVPQPTAGSQDKGTPQAVGSVPPGTPLNAAATYSNTTQKTTVTWTDLGSPLSPTESYSVYRAAWPMTKSADLLLATRVALGIPRGTQQLVFAPPPTQATVYYAVVAVDFYGNASSPDGTAGVLEDNTPPGVPARFAAVAGNGQATLTWINPTDADFAGVMVRRSTVGFPATSGAGTQAYNGSGTGFVDAGLVNGTTYYYTAFSYDTMSPPNYSAASAQASAAPTAPAVLSPPSSPTGLTAQGGAGVATLSWSSAAGATGYVVQRTGPGGVGPYATVGTTLGTTFTDTGLAAGTTYAYEVEAANAAGTSGPSGSASALTIPPPPTSLSASGATAQVTLNWSFSTIVTGFAVLRGTSAGGSYAPVGTTTATGFTDASAANGRIYFYVVEAANASGSSGNSADVEAFTTPTPPTALSAADVPGDEGGVIQLFWVPSTAAVSTAEILSRSTTSSGGFTVLATLGGSVSTYLDGTAPTGTPYYYEIQASAGSLLSVPSNIATATSIDNLAPAAPTNLLAANTVGTEGGSITLTWTLSTDDRGGARDVASYRVLRNSVLIATLPAGASGYLDPAAVTGTSYTYTVRAVDASGNVSPDSNSSSAASADTLPPGAPQSLFVIGGDSRVSLSWVNPIAPDLAQTVIRYNTGATCAYPVSMTSGTGVYAGAVTAAYTDLSVTNGQSYCYSVFLLDTAANVSAPGVGFATPNAVAATAPAAASNLAASDVTGDNGGSIRLAWTASPSTNVVAYHVYRSATSGFSVVPGDLIGSVAAPATTFVDTGAYPVGTTYYYIVRAYNGTESSDSNQASAFSVNDLPPSAPTGMGAANVAGNLGGSIQAVWTPSTSPGVTEERLYRSTTSGTNYVQVASFSPSTTSYVDPNATVGTVFYYVAAAWNGTALSTFSNQASAASIATEAGPVTGVFATPASGSVTLRWAMPATAPDFAGVKVERSTSGFPAMITSGTTVYNGGSTGFVDFSVVNGTTYYYTAFAYGSGGFVATPTPGSMDKATPQAAGAGPQPPTAPTGVGAVYSTATQKTTVTWTDLAGSLSPPETYDVYRAPWPMTRAQDLGLATRVALGIARGTQSFIYTPPPTEATVYYAVTAVDSTGLESFPDGTVGVVEDNLPPADVSGLTAAAGNGNVVLRWSAPPTAPDLTGIVVRRSTVGFPATVGVGTSVYNGSSTGFVDSGLVNGTTYYYAAFVTDSFGNASIPGAGSMAEAMPQVPTTTPPAAPTSLTAADVPNDLGGSIQTYWTPSTSPGVTEERLYRSTTSGTNYVQIASFSPSATSYVDPNATVGTLFYYVAAAWNGVALSTYSNQASAASIANEAGPVTGVFATPASGSVTLRWTMPVTAPDFAGIQVERSVSGFPAAITVGTTVYNGGSTGFVDLSVANGTTYYYTAFAYGSSGFVAVPNPGSFGEATPQSVGTGPVPPTAPTGASATYSNATQKTTVTWTDLPGPLSPPETYDVYRAPWPMTRAQDLGLATRVAIGIARGMQNFVYTPPPTEATVYYAVTAVDSTGLESLPDGTVGVLEDNTPPAVPSRFAAVAGNTQVALSWVNPTDADFAGVLVRRSTSSFPATSGDGIQVFNGGGTGLTDSAVVNGTTYYYTAFSYDTMSPPNFSPPYAQGSATPATSAVDIPPVADAGPNQSTAVDRIVFLNGSGSYDADNGPGPLTYAWTFASYPVGSTAPGTLMGATTTFPSFFADLQGQYVLSLSVSDGLLTSPTRTVAISAFVASSATVSIAPNPFIAGNSVTLQVADTDMNLSPGAIDSLQVQVQSGLGDKEIVTLYETGPNTGVFVRAIPTARSAGPTSGNGALEVSGVGDFAFLTYVDPIDANGSANQVVTAAATVSGVIPGPPTGTIALQLQPSAIHNDGSETATVTGIVTDAEGNPVVDGTLVTVSTTLGQITTPDATTAVPGIQVTTLNGDFSFSVGATTTLGTATLTAQSVPGTATGTASLVVFSSAYYLAIASGNGQQGLTGQPLAQPLVVEVLTSTGTPVPGVTVTFTPIGGGLVSPTQAVTGGTGLAQTLLTLGSSPGLNTVTASVPTNPGVTFQESAIAPRTIVAVSGSGQTGQAGVTLAQPFVAQVTDATGNPVTGAIVSFFVASGGGALSAATAAADVNGRAGTTLTLGPSLGLNAVTATVAFNAGPPASFTAQAGPGRPFQVAIVPPTDTPLDHAMFVRILVEDRFGNLVSGDSATSFSVRVDGNATFTQTSGQGVLLGGAGTPQVFVEDVAGVAEVGLTDSVPETVHLLAFDSQGNGLVYPMPTLQRTSVGTLPGAVYYQTGTRLQDGRVLLAGGRIGQGFSNSDLAVAGIFDPGTGTLTATGSLNVPRANHTATLLQDGRVLVVGGSTSNRTGLASAELYYPQAGTFGLVAGSLSFARYHHAAAPLADGRVLIVGGTGSSGGPITASCEIFYPATGTFGTTGSMITARMTAAVVPLKDGRVLVAGGGGGAAPIGGAVESAELYDPSTGIFSAVSGRVPEGDFPTGTLLGDGSVLIASGWDPVYSAVTTAAQRYVPGTGLLPAAGLNTPRTKAASMRLPTGHPLVFGGMNNGYGGVGSLEVYDPIQGRWISQPLATPRFDGALAPLGVGLQFLVAGGRSSSGSPLSSDEVWALGGSVPARFFPGGTARVVVLPPGTVNVPGPMPVTYAAEDFFGNLVTTDNATTFTATVSSPLGGALLVTPQPVTLSNGRVTIQVRDSSSDQVTFGASGGSCLSGVDCSATAAGLFTAPVAQLLKLAGDGQTGIVGSIAPQPLTVRALDGNGAPIEGALIAFTVLAGGGSVNPTSAMTDASGNASTLLTLSARAGTVRVGAASGATSVVFQEVGVPGPPAVLAKVSGDGQAGTVGTQFANPLAVQVADAFGNPVSGVGVAWSLTQGTGSFSPPSGLTDSTGRVLTFLTPSAAELLTASASVTGVGSVTFTEQAGGLRVLRLVSGTGQFGTIGMSLAQPFVVGVTDAVSGDPVTNALVTFVVASGGGYVTQAQVRTDPTGQASTTLVLGNQVGTQTVVAGVQLQSGPNVSFSAAAIPGAPAKVVLLPPASVSIDGLMWLTAEVQDSYGNLVTWDSATKFGLVVTGRGPAFVSSIGEGSVLSGANTLSIRVQDQGGLVVVGVLDTIAEKVDFAAIDTDGNGLNYAPIQFRDEAAVPMITPRAYFRAVTLKDGRVLIAGGRGVGSSLLTQAEIYDPRLNQTTSVAPLNQSRFLYEATLLNDGRVLLTGGITGGPCPLSSAEIFYPQTATFGLVPMVYTHSKHTATLMTDGRVLVVGGNNTCSKTSRSAASEIFDPSTNRFTATGSLGLARHRHAAALLGSGQVLVADGGQGRSSSAEVFTPSSGTFSSVSPVPNYKEGGLMTPLADGRVFFTGGRNNQSTYLYTPTLNAWTQIGNLSTPRYKASLAFLPDGTIVIPGGAPGRNSCANSSVDTFSPGTLALGSGPTLQQNRQDYGLAPVLAGFGALYLEGGTPCRLQSTNPVASAELLVKRGAVQGVFTGGRTERIGVLTPADAAVTQPMTVTFQTLDRFGNLVTTDSTTTFTVNVFSPSASAAITTPEPVTVMGGVVTVVAVDSTPEPVTYGIGGGSCSALDCSATASALFLGIPTAITKTAGDLQTGTVGSFEAQPLVVQVTDGAGRMLQGIAVSFSVVSGGGAVAPSSALTDASGFASTTLLLPPQPGIVSVLATAGATSAMFMEAAVTGPPAVLAKFAGDGQLGVVGNAYAAPLEVVVADAFGNPVSGVSVVWSVTQGSASLAPNPTTTNAFGHSQSLATPLSSGTVSLAASVTGAGSVVFTEQAGSLRGVSVLSGSGQAGTVGQPLAQPFVVRVTDAGTGNPVTGVPVTFAVTAGGGYVTQAQVTTDALGDASTTLVLGTQAGVAQSVAAGVPLQTGPNALFTATGTAGAPAKVVLLPVQNVTLDNVMWLTAEIQDRYGNLVTADGSTKFQLRVTGAAAYFTTTVGQGTVLSGGNTQSVRVQDQGGIVVVGVADTLPERVELAAFDSEGNGLTYPPITWADQFVASMSSVRAYHQAVVLQDGRILLLGGRTSNTGVTANAEIYDPRKNQYVSVGPMTSPRSWFTATLLNDGRVLVAGGYPCGRCNGTNALSSAEIFNPQGGTFTPVAMVNPHASHAAVLLPNGKVLVAGGAFQLGSRSRSTAMEVFDPGTNSFTATNSLNFARHRFGAVVLADGRVFLAGSGRQSAEIYYPSSGTVGLAAAPPSQFEDPQMKLLPNGKVLITAMRESFRPLGGSYLYDPAANAWSSGAGLSTAVDRSAGATLDDGTWVVAGGRLSSFCGAGDIDVLPPGGTTFQKVAGLARTRDSFTASSVSGIGFGAIYAAGGRDQCNGGGWSGTALNSAELVVEHGPVAASFLPGGPEKIVVLTPANVSVTQSMSVTYETLDRFGNLATGDNAATFTATVFSTSASAVITTPQPVTMMGGVVTVVATDPNPEGATFAASGGICGTIDCSSTATAFFLGVPASVTKVAGDLQTARVGSFATQPLEVRVTDGSSLAVQDYPVVFSILSGGGVLSPSIVRTDTSGVASALLQSPPQAGTVTVEATAGTAAVAFTETAVTGPAAVMAKFAGDGQVGLVGTPFAVPLDVVVADAFGNPVAGTQVVWAATVGSAAAVPNPSTTDALGHAEAIVTPATSGDLAIQATVLGAGSVLFGEQAGDLRAVTVLSGSGQTGTVGQPLAQPFVVRVTDAGTGFAVTDALVTFVVTAGGGYVTQAQVRTDALGDAAATLVLGSEAGIPDAVAAGVQLQTGPNAVFTATGVAAPPARVVLLPVLNVSVDDLMWLTAEVQDAYGNLVTWDDATKFQLVATGIATSFLAGSGQGTILSGANTGTVRVQDQGGLVVVGVSDMVPGPVDFGAIDSEGNGLSYPPFAWQDQPVASMGVARAYHESVTLGDGRVLILGGRTSQCGVTNSAVVYDPRTNQYASVGPMNAARHWFQATLLNDGRVLVTGGAAGACAPCALSSAELFYPAAGTFGVVPMVYAHQAHAASLLQDGRVLVAGGSGGCGISNRTANAEVFNPATNSFAGVGAMNAARHRHESILLGDGRVLEAGSGRHLTETFDPKTGGFTGVGSFPGGHSHEWGAMLPMADGRPLLIGGAQGGRSGTTETLLFDPGSNAWSTGPSLKQGRTRYSGAVAGGTLVVAGGEATNRACALNGVELLPPGASKFQSGPNLTVARSEFAVAPVGLAFGGALLSGGRSFCNGWRGTSLSSAELIVEHGAVQGVFLPAGTARVVPVASNATVTQPVVVTYEAQDRFGNLVTTDFSTTFTATVASSSASAAVSSPQPVTVFGGTATVVATDAVPETATFGASGGSCATLDCTATATVLFLGVPSSMTKPAGDLQTGVVGSVLPVPLTVLVRDGSSRPLQGIAVTFVLVSGGGTLSNVSLTTDATGEAYAILSLPLRPGIVTVDATVGGVGTVAFVAQALAGAPAVVAVASGDHQTAQVSTALPAPIAVAVADSYGNPVSGASVTWTPVGASGGAAPNPATTNAAGIGAALWTLGGGYGTQQMAASVTGAGSVVFTAAATTPVYLSVVSGNNQVGSAGTSLPNPFVVLVTNSAGGWNVTGAAVTFTATAGGGLVNPATMFTDSNGQAAATLRLGNLAGMNQVVADVPGRLGSPAVFNALATPGVPSQVVILPPQNVTVDNAMFATFVEEDAYGNRVTWDNATRFTATVDGSAVFAGVSGGGSMISTPPTQSAVVQIYAGEVTLAVHDVVAETVDFGALDSQGTGMTFPGNVYSMRPSAFSWYDVSASPNHFYLSDDGSAVAPIGFSFGFLGGSYTSLLISANGYLTFGTSGGVSANAAIPNGAQPNNLIAPFWTDLNPAGTWPVDYQMLGSTPGARKFVVEWYQTRSVKDSTSPLTFEAVLDEGTGSILFQYQSMNGPYGDGRISTVGIENAVGSAGVQYEYDQAGSIGSNQAILFGKFGASGTFFPGAPAHVIESVPSPAWIGNPMLVVYETVDQYGNIARGDNASSFDAVVLGGSATLSVSNPVVVAGGQIGVLASDPFPEVVTFGASGGSCGILDCSMTATGLFKVTGPYVTQVVGFAWDPAADPGSGTSFGMTGSGLAAGSASLLPFPFFLYATSYTSLWASTSGLVSLTSQTATTTNVPFPTLGFPAALAPFWAYLTIPALGDVRWGAVGTAPMRRFVVTWTNASHQACADQQTFQTVLFEGSEEIRYNYRQISPNASCNGAETVGMNYGNGVTGNALPASNLAGGTSLLFTP